MNETITMREGNPRIELAQMSRDEKVMARAKSLIVDLQRMTQLLTKKDISKWRSAWQIAISVENPKRSMLYDVYDDDLIDNHLIGAIRNRKLKVIGKPFKLVDRKTKEENEELTELLRKRWFKKLLSLALDSIFWGHSLIQVGDVISDENGMRFSDVKLVPRRHVAPEFGTLLKNISDEAKKGINYRKAFADWIIEVCEDDTDLGLLNALSPQCIAKRNALAFWDQFGELFGMPVRIGKTLSRDQKDIDKVASMLDQMGSAAYGVFPEGTEIEIVESSKGDSFNVYDKRVERANSEMSKAVLGQTMTMDNGSSKSQAEVHQDVSDEIAAADADFLCDLVNDKILPLLNKHGFGLESVKFEWDETRELSPTEMLEVLKIILQYYEVDEAYFIKKHNIPITGKRMVLAPPVPPGDTGKPVAEPQKKKPEQVKLASITTLLDDSYSACPNCGGVAITLAIVDSMVEKEANRIALAIFQGKKLPGNIDPKIVARVYELLRRGMVEGFGADMPALDMKTPDYKMLESLQQNVYHFSVAKNYAELQEMKDLLLDGERVRSFSEFKGEAVKLHKLFSVEYLQTEYATAVNGSELAARWVQYQANKEAMPNLSYQTVGDRHVRDSHAVLNGVKRPIDDDFWKTYYPPNGWNCRCTVNQTGDGAITPDKKVVRPDMLAMFKTNLAEKGLVFPADHPYFDGLPEDLKKKKP